MDNQTEKSRQIARVVTIIPLGAEPKASEYWRTRPPQERLDALEQIRVEYHDWKYNGQPGFQRVFNIVKR